MDTFNTFESTFAGHYVQKMVEKRLFLRFQGAKINVRCVFVGRNLQESAYFQGFAINDVKFGYAFGLIILRKAAGHSGLFQSDDAYYHSNSMDL